MKLGALADLVERLRRCATKGDPSVRPYTEASISIERVHVDVLVPLSKYVLEDQLRRVADLQDELSRSDIDIFDLAYGIAWFDDDTRAITPPIVEAWENEGLLLVDGLHRVWTAKQQGRTEVTCVVVRGVTTPLVPLPLGWGEVKVFPSGHYPEAHQKRAYRFTDRHAVQAAVPMSADLVTEENYQYFLFRDLSETGSSGIRDVATEK